MKIFEDELKPMPSSKQKLFSACPPLPGLFKHDASHNIVSQKLCETILCDALPKSGIKCFTWNILCQILAF